MMFEADRPGKARFGCHPDEHRQRGHEQLDDQTRGADGGAAQRRCERRRSARIDVGHRHEYEQHHAHLVHLAAAMLHRVAVPEFMRSP